MNLLNELKDVTVTEEQLRDIKDLLGIEQEWRPKLGELYWGVEYNSREWIVVRYTNRVEYRSTTEKRLMVGNVFETGYHAREEVNKRNFLQQMELDFKKNSGDIDWGNRKDKYAMVYDHEDNFVEVILWYTRQHGNLHTTNREWLEQYIKDNEENIKKYYFGVGE